MRIDTESHFWTPEFLDYLGSRDSAPRLDLLEGGARAIDSNVSHRFIGIVPPLIQELALDLGEGRLAKMDACGIDVALLSLTVPGVEQLPGEESIAQARRANDALAAAVAAHPDRFVGMAVVAPLRPEESVEELERCAEQGFKAVNLLGHVGDEDPYLDHPKYRPIFAAAERLGLPINLHPGVPHAKMIEPFLGYGWGLPTMGLGFGAETAVQTMRLILSGLFDEHPDLKVTLGHFGESLPFWTRRLDAGWSSTRLSTTDAPRCEHAPSHYLQNNFWFNSSGNFHIPALFAALLDVGADRLMFASDYPWEAMEEATEWMESAPLSQVDREKMEWRNAAELFGIAVPVSA